MLLKILSTKIFSHGPMREINIFESLAKVTVRRGWGEEKSEGGSTRVEETVFTVLQLNSVSEHDTTI